MIESVTKTYAENEDTQELEHTGFTLLYVGSSEKWFVPKIEDNRHYQEILAWVNEGNTIIDPEE